jgi:hypothetical protein
MNTVRKALALVEPYLATQRYWAKVMTMNDQAYFEAGPIHDNGLEECPTYSGIVRENGVVVESHRRI